MEIEGASRIILGFGSLEVDIFRYSQIMMSKIRKFAILGIGIFPGFKIKNLILRALKLEIGRDSRIGSILIWDVAHFFVGEGSTIGAFNVFRDLQSFKIGSGSIIGHFNWISGAKVLVAKGAPCRFEMKNESALTSRHYVDATGFVEIGSYSTIAGVRSTIISHGINWKTNEQTFSQVKVGDYCIIGSNVAIPPGSLIPSNSIVGMGATFDPRQSVESGLFIASRASSIKTNLEGEYFRRRNGKVE